MNLKRTLIPPFVLLIACCSVPDLNEKEVLLQAKKEAIQISSLRKEFMYGMMWLYVDENNETFTGWVKETYSNENFKSLGYLKKGQKQGLWLGWHENGVQKSKIQWNLDSLSGTYQLWHSNKTIHVTGQTLDGEMDGEWKEYYTNGNLQALSLHDYGKCISKKNQDIFLLSRRTSDKDQSKFKEIITGFDDLDEINLPRIDHVYIAIGKKLDSSELLYIPKSDRDNFIRVDCEYVLKIAKKAFDNGAKSIAIVSAIGADKNSYNLYLKTKGNMENLIKKIGYSKTIFAQPSHLLGKRVNESFKLDVSLIELGGKIFAPLMLGPFSDFKFVEARDVAKAMVQKMNDDSSGLTILRYKDFVNI